MREPAATAAGAISNTCANLTSHVLSLHIRDPSIRTHREPSISIPILALILTSLKRRCASFRLRKCGHWGGPFLTPYSLPKSIHSFAFLEAKTQILSGSASRFDKRFNAKLGVDLSAQVSLRYGHVYKCMPRRVRWHGGLVPAQYRGTRCGSYATSMHHGKDIGNKR